MNIAEFSIRNKVSTLVLTVMLIVGGLLAYQTMGRLEDPEFTIKEAIIMTPYPGATAEEVEQEVTDEIEKAVQQLGQLDYVKSTSWKGMSRVNPSIKKKYDKSTLPQVWDELRRKVNDAQGKLPPGAGPSIVNDDYGDVYGIYFAITGDGYSMAELEDIAKFFQRELLLVQDVAKIDIGGVVPETIYIEMLRDQMAQLGINKQQIYSALSDKNLVADAGHFRIESDYLSLRPTGDFRSVQEMGSLLISTGKGKDSERQIYLRDIAEIKRSYQEPPNSLLRVDGKPAVSLAISTAAGGNVVTMGNLLTERIKELAPLLPAGVKLHPISIQSEAVTIAINGFVVSLLEAVAIVVVVLMVFMGLRSGLLIGFILFVTICGTFILMKQQGVLLERISLGALIIALGMLVDNAIVVVDGILVGIQKGDDRVESAKSIVGQTMIPLLGATTIAILAFAAIGTSQDSTGEYCRSLFLVILYSLGLSWVTAITITPLLGVMFLKSPKGGGDGKDPYGGKFYSLYGSFLKLCIKLSWLTVGVMVALLALAMFGFKYVDKSFFPNSTRPQFMVDLWLEEGTHIETTAQAAEEVRQYLMTVDGIESVTSVIGQGAPRFILTYGPEAPNSAYAFLLVTVDDYKIINDLQPQIQQHLEKTFPAISPVVYKFLLGPGDALKIQLRISGQDKVVLRGLAEQVMEIMREDGGLMGTQTDWRQQVMDLRPIVAEPQARRHGLERPDIAQVLKEWYDGVQAGVFREGDKLLPIISRTPPSERRDVSQYQDLIIWSQIAGQNIPLQQVLKGFETTFVNGRIWRRDRSPTITVKCTPRSEQASTVLERIIPKIAEIDVPPGYKFEWGGEYESSSDAQAGLAAMLPVFIVMMILIVIFLFNSLKQPLIIWLCVPLALIGVTAGLLLTGQPFGFMALLGLLSLIGMLIKNAIVLIDQINLEIREGKPIYDAIIHSAQSRMRPVMMAAGTTVLGMIPLLFDAFFVAMAVTIMAGLTFASILTLVIVPVLYSMFYRAKPT